MRPQTHGGLSYTSDHQLRVSSANRSAISLINCSLIHLPAISPLQSSLQRYRCQVIHPMGGVKDTPLSRLQASWQMSLFLRFQTICDPRSSHQTILPKQTLCLLSYACCVLVTSLRVQWRKGQQGQPKAQSLHGSKDSEPLLALMFSVAGIACMATDRTSANAEGAATSRGVSGLASFSPKSAQKRPPELR